MRPSLLRVVSMQDKVVLNGGSIVRQTNYGLILGGVCVAFSSAVTRSCRAATVFWV
jgi:hypothetical protein